MKRAIGTIIIELLPSVTREIYASMRSLAQPELTVFQFRILKKLFLSPGTNNELAQWAGINKATMSRALATLEKRGLIERKTDEKDRRGNYIYLTPLGKIRFKTIRKIVGAMISKKAERINMRKQKELIKGLEVLKEVFNK